MSYRVTGIVLMLTKLRHSLPLQLMLAALLAWFLAQLISPTSDVTQSGWYQFLMLGKTTYIGLLKMVVGLVVLFSLLQGITSIGSITRLKKIGRNTVLFYSFTTLIAISFDLYEIFLRAHPMMTIFGSGHDRKFYGYTAGETSQPLIRMRPFKAFSAVSRWSLSKQNFWRHCFRVHVRFIGIIF